VLSLDDYPAAVPDTPPPDVEQRGSRTVFANAWVRLTEDEIVRSDGSTGEYAVLHAPDFAVVLPFDGERFHLVEQYRYPVRARLWEFPQGSVAHAASPEEAATVELAEECGLAADHMLLLGFLHESNGRSTSGFHAYLATGLHPVEAERELEEHDLVTGAFTVDEIWDLVESGRMTDAASLAALALLGRAQAQGRAPAT
jgi:8-oxo-dGTP pyrophosphatase MutT (NUDIX family)